VAVARMGLDFRARRPSFPSKDARRPMTDTRPSLRPVAPPPEAAVELALEPPAVPGIDLSRIVVIDPRTLLADTDAESALTAASAAAWSMLLSGLGGPIGPES